MTIAQHSAETAEWYTPAEYVEAARATMGCIDVDPASCDVAQRTVKAARYYTAESDGLKQLWHGNVFLNPPGGENNEGSLVAQFWRKAMLEWQHARLKQLVYVGYALEQLATLQNVAAGFTPLDCSICVPRKRIRFTPAVGTAGSPTHANFICYLGPHADRFGENFNQFGRVVLR